jgi:hypothetical protein
MEAKFLTEKQVAERYAIGLRQLQRMRMFGTGPIFKKISGQLGKTGGKIIYSVAEIELWLSTRPQGGERVAVWPPKAETR